MKILKKIKEKFHWFWYVKIRKIGVLKTKSLNKVKDKHIEKLSRYKDNHHTPMNMVKNKKSGVVVVVPGNAQKVKDFYGDKAKDYKLVESKIK